MLSNFFHLFVVSDCFVRLFVFLLAYFCQCLIVLSMFRFWLFRCVQFSVCFSGLLHLFAFICFRFVLLHLVFIDLFPSWFVVFFHFCFVFAFILGLNRAGNHS